MKKTLSFLLVLLMAMSILTTVAFAEDVTGLSGEGAMNNPYLITNIDEFKFFRDAVNSGESYSGKYIQLDANIDLSSEVNWTPIGNSTNKFEGYFDGNHKTISNLTISRSSENHVGLFGYIKGTSMASTATPSVKNLTLTNVSVSGYHYVGALAGQSFTSNITNVSVQGTVNGRRYIGGLIGHVYTHFQDCTFTGNAFCSYDALGGIAGAGDCRAYNCAVYADVTGSNWVGGIVGNGQEGTSAVGCYVKGTISSDSNYYRGVGGIAGVAGHGYSNSIFKDNYFDGEVYLENEKVDAIVMGFVNAANNEAIQSTVEGNSWNTEYYPANTPVYVTADVSQNATAEEWVASTSDTLTGERNNNLIMLESDLEYLDATSMDDVTIMSFSNVKDTNEKLNEQLENNTKIAELNGTTYPSLQAAVNAAEDNDTIVLLKSVKGPGIVIDKSITIDFGGNTYTFTSGVGSIGTPSNGFQILKNNTVALQNGKLDVTFTARKGFYVLVQNYANLTVTDMILDGTNLDKWSGTDGDSYVLSNNSGEVLITGKTDIIANDEGDLAYAMDSHEMDSYPIPTVTVNTTGTISGPVEVTGGTMNIQNGTFEDAFVFETGSLTISGGTFAVMPDAAYLAEGLTAYDLKDGYWVVTDVENIVTVTYTDGVPGREIFPDQVYENLLIGMDTPVFNPMGYGYQGYAFNGWTPAVSETITGSVTYTATWRQTHFQIDTPVKPGKPAVTPDVPVTPIEPETPHDCLVEKFADLNENAWYHDAVDYVLETGLMRGVSTTESLFDPYGTTSRAMIVTILYRMEGEPTVTGENPFSDVADDEWYTDAVLWAAENEIVLGYDGAFFPTDDVTAEQLMLILQRYAEYKGWTVDDAVAAMIAPYDYSAWADNGVIWAHLNGVLNIGTEITDLTAPATRAELAGYLYQFAAVAAN